MIPSIGLSIGGAGGSGCTIVTVPGWAAIAIVAIAAAPRLVRQWLRSDDPPTP